MPIPLEKYRKNRSIEVVCHYCGDKSHIRPLCHVRNVRVHDSLMTWTPKCPNTNPLVSNVSWRYKLPC